MPKKARARLLYHTISTSERVSELGVKGALLFTWLFAHADDQGRYAGSARKARVEVVPLIDEITIEDVEQALKEMEEAKLIIRYIDGKRPLIQIADWWTFQSGLRVRYESRYPAPEGWEDKIKIPPAQARDESGKYKPKPMTNATVSCVSAKEAVMNLLGFGEVSTYTIGELTETLGRPLAEVEWAVEELHRAGTVDVIDTKTGEFAEAPFHSTWRVSIS